LEDAHRSTLENHVYRSPRLGSRRSVNLRIGIRPPEVRDVVMSDLEAALFVAAITVMVLLAQLV
jgi:hypothetical protein